jgi:hypothetical protein
MKKNTATPTAQATSKRGRDHTPLSIDNLIATSLLNRQ